MNKKALQFEVRFQIDNVNLGSLMMHHQKNSNGSLEN